MSVAGSPSSGMGVNELLPPVVHCHLYAQGWKPMARLAIVFGPLIEALKGEVDLGALKSGCL